MSDVMLADTRPVCPPPSPLSTLESPGWDPVLPLPPPHPSPRVAGGGRGGGREGITPQPQLGPAELPSLHSEKKCG